LILPVKFFAYRLNINYWRELFRFLRSNAYGANLEKIDARFDDLLKIQQMIRHKSSVLEFGSGFSTLFFAYSKKVGKLTTLEENELYLPKIKNAKFEHFCLDVINVKFGNSLTRKYINLPANLKVEFDLIYVDGPTTPRLAINEAAPNIDLLEIPKIQLKNSIIAIDIRIKTVELLQEYLRETHYLLVSKKCYLKGMKLTEKVHNNLQKNLAYHLKLTSLLIPKNYKY
jgi:hypothetical protein